MGNGFGVDLRTNQTDRSAPTDTTNPPYPTDLPDT